MRLTEGDQVRVALTKWGDRPHWEFDATYLGSDEHGDWIGIAAGTVMHRPGATYVAPTAQVGLVPPAGPDDGRRWLATFHDVGGPVRVYVDITTPPYWDGSVLRAVDLDLDVVRENSGRVYVDDQDEFAEHQVQLGYPDDLVAAALAACASTLVAVTGGRPPYDDDTAAAWLARVER